MARTASGQVLEPDGKRRSWTLRVRAYGKRHHITLGRSEDGWTRKRAEAELTLTLAQIELGRWEPPAYTAPVPPVAPEPPATFHEFASEWFAQHERGWEPHTAKTYRGLLVNHLLPFFCEHALAQVTVAEVDRFRDDRLSAAAARDMQRAAVLAYNEKHPAGPRPLPRRLGTTTINKTLVLLGSILAVAEERDLITRNPMRVNP